MNEIDSICNKEQEERQKSIQTIQSDINGWADGRDNGGGVDDLYSTVIQRQKKIDDYEKYQ